MTPLENVYDKIKNFAEYFNDTECAPEYTQAWQLNKKHGLYLHSLPEESITHITNLIREHKPMLILEIGTSIGYSALRFAEALSEHGGEIYTIEKSAPKAEIARIHFRESGLDNIHLLEGKAEIILKDWNKQIDILFLDADRKHYLDFLQTLEPPPAIACGSEQWRAGSLSPSALIIADNVSNFPDEVTSFLSYIKGDPCYKAEILPLPNGLLVASKIK